MPLTYRRPGVYLEESLLVNPSDVAGTVTAACFVGATQKGPINEPVLCESWSDFVTQYGNLDPITVPAAASALSYLPFSVYSFFQNGGRFAWIIRSAPTAPADRGSPATLAVNDASPAKCFDLTARSAGSWGNNLQYGLTTQSTVGVAPNVEDVFALQILLKNSEGIYEVVETFTSLSMKGSLQGTRKVDSVINDSASGSQYVICSSVDATKTQPAPTTTPRALIGGIDPKLPDAAAMIASAQAVTKLEGPITLNICSYLTDASKADTIDVATVFVGATVPSSSFGDRQDIFIINDSAPPRAPGASSSAYKTSLSSTLGANPGDSYSASYTPWLIVPHPARVGTTVNIPPGGAVIGMMARIDATIGVFRAPAGVIAGLSNAVGVQTKFTDTELGDLNAQNINVIRSVVGAGICVMGGRTRKSYGTDRYISARRTLIFVKEVMRRSTQFAVFENNDQRLWSSLRMAADRILRPLWEAGGLRGASAAQAYRIRCDDTLNTPQVIAAGEVHMEIGVALEYPAEFVIIKLTQFDQGTYTTEVVPAA
jgi:uncharacterized protein